MQISLDLSTVLTLLGMTQATLLAGVLMVKRGNVLCNRILAALLASISIVFGGLILAHTKQILLVPHLAQIHNPIGFLIPPLLFLYIRTITSENSRLRRTDFLHFIPFLFVFIYLLPFYIQSSTAKVSYLNSVLDNYPLEWRIRSILMFAQQLIYLIFSYELLRKRENQQNHVVAKQQHSLYIAKTLLIVSSVFLVITFTRLVLAHGRETNLLAPVIAGAFICGLIFKILQKPEFLGMEEEKPLRKYEKSTLKTGEAERYLNQIIDLMEIEKLYLDRDLTLEKAAKRLSILPSHFSQIINEHLNQNFSDFVNSYRVEEFKKRFSDPQNNRYTIVAIAEASGFNSKSAFNSAFKKHTNLTPSEFKKTLSPQN